MAIVQHRQIETAINSHYTPHLDLSDLNKSDDQHSILSRGLAAYALSYLSNVDPSTAGKAITDGYNDNGIDLIYYDKEERILHLMQSKWNSSHSGSIRNGDVLKFTSGIKDLLNSRYSRFNMKISQRQSEIDNAIGQASKVLATIVYSGSGSFSEENKNSMNDFVEEVDETRELVSYHIVSQQMLHGFLLQGAAGSSISTTVNLIDWGYISEPFSAYYGQISAHELVALYEKFGHRIFSRNIRMFLGDITEVNRGIQDTVRNHPDWLWYFNNGVTALATAARRRPGAQRSAGLLDCEGFSIVNGAQTIGSLAAALREAPEAGHGARIQIRIVSLDGAPDEFAALVTRTNNTQNRIDSRNFVSLDPEQERLRGEFGLDNIDYEYRQGEIEKSGGKRLDLVEATVALACAEPDVALAVQAKREIGKLWEDITRPPYKTLFNKGRTSDDIWSKVKIFRRINDFLSIFQLSSTGKAFNIWTHGNRLIAHLSYQRLIIEFDKAKLDAVRDEDIIKVVQSVGISTIEIIERDYSENYVASLFKNLTKCRAIARSVLGKLLSASPD